MSRKHGFSALDSREQIDIHGLGSAGLFFIAGRLPGRPAAFGVLIRPTDDTAEFLKFCEYLFCERWAPKAFSFTTNENPVTLRAG
jgi:hypothetical protein